MVDLLWREECFHAVLLDHGAPVDRESNRDSNVAFILFDTAICKVTLTEDTSLLAQLETLAERAVLCVLVIGRVVEFGEPAYPANSSLLLIDDKVRCTQKHR